MTAMTHRRRCRRVVAIAALSLALIVVAGSRTASAQGAPPDVVAAIEAAIDAGRKAATNALLSAAMINDALRTQIAQQTGARVTESSVAEAVVEGIARHPQAAPAIVRAAVERAPQHRAAIMHRASLAYPRFALQIAAAAGVPPVAAAPPAPYTPPVPYPAPYMAPAPYVAPAVTRVAQAAPQPAPGPAPARRTGPLGVTELRFGVVHHDTGVFGRNEEDGVDLSLEARFSPLGGDIWEFLWNPRPLVGVNVSTVGDTSSLYAGLNWEWDVWGPVFISLDLGGAVHDGKLSTSELDRKELGSRVLFRQALEIGYRVFEHHALSIRFDHLSNAGLVDNNEGLDTLGVVYSYRY